MPPTAPRSWTESPSIPADQRPYLRQSARLKGPAPAAAATTSVRAPSPLGVPHDLAYLIKESVDKIAHEYERTQQLAKEDPGTSGDQVEENWAEILRQWLPRTFHVVTKGRIVSSKGLSSNQIDVLILSPFYPQGLLSNKLYIAAGVLAAFECKRTLRRSHILRLSRLALDSAHWSDLISVSRMRYFTVYWHTLTISHRNSKRL